jgi:alpha-glucosidase
MATEGRKTAGWLTAIAWAVFGCATPKQSANVQFATDAAAQDLQQGADAAADATADAATIGDTAGSEVEAADSTGEAADATASTDTTAPADCVPRALISAAAPACGAKPQLPSWATCSGSPTHCKLDVVGPTGLAHGIEVDWLLKGAVRLRYRTDAAAQFVATPALVANPKLATLSMATGQTCEGVVTCSGELMLHVDPQGRAQVWDAAGTLLLEDPPQGGLAVDNLGRLQLQRRAPAGERYYGLGGKTGALDRRGRVLTLWNTDAYKDSFGGYDPAGDPLYQSIPWLLMRRQGTAWGVLTDHPFRQSVDLAASDPQLWRVTGEGPVIDQIAVAGPSPAQVLDNYTQLTGRPAMPPLWALGYHQSRWGWPDAAAFLAIAKQFRDLQLPCDALWFDIQKMHGFRSFTWDSNTFPDPKGLVGQLAAQGFRSVAIVDPGLKVDAGWPIYASALSNALLLGQTGPGAPPYIGEVWPGKAAFPDFSKPATRQWWAEQLVPLETQHGVAGLWIDMNEPSDFSPGQQGTVPNSLVTDHNGQPATMAADHNLYAMYEAQATFDGLLAASPNQRPFVLTRAGYAGIQRYAGAWTGDAPSTQASLAGTLPMLLGMALSGQALVGSDVGGYSGNASPALFARWMAVGSISPFFRGHVQTSAKPQEPWQFGTEVLDLSRDLIGERYRLLPYWYSLFDHARRTGTPPLRPLWWHDGQDAALDDLGDQVLLGPWLMAAPLLDPEKTSRSVVFPPGRWFEARSGAVIDGPQTLQVSGPLAALPLYVRQGAILPRAQLRQFSGQAPISALEIEVWPGKAQTEFTLFEDAGDGSASAARRRMLYSLAATATGMTLTSALQLDVPQWQPTPRRLVVRVRRVDHLPSGVQLAGQPLPKVADATQLAGTAQGWSWDQADLSLWITLPDQDNLALQATYDPTLLQPDPPVAVPLQVKLPAGTPLGSAVYVAHSGNGWQHIPLAPGGQAGVAVGTALVPRGQWFEYKYSRGSWQTVEKWPGCQEASNRYAFGAAHPGKADEVFAWADLCK